jgi:hypothetical protein
MELVVAEVVASHTVTAAVVRQGMTMVSGRPVALAEVELRLFATPFPQI